MLLYNANNSVWYKMTEIQLINILGIYFSYDSHIRWSKLLYIYIYIYIMLIWKAVLGDPNRINQINLKGHLGRPKLHCLHIIINDNHKWLLFLLFFFFFFHLSPHRDGECNASDMPGKGWIGREEPAKIIVTFPLIPEGYQVPQVGR